MNIIRKYFIIRFKWGEEQLKGYIRFLDICIKLNWVNVREMKLLKKWCEKKLKKFENK